MFDWGYAADSFFMLFAFGVGFGLLWAYSRRALLVVWLIVVAITAISIASGGNAANWGLGANIPAWYDNLGYIILCLAGFWLGIGTGKVTGDELFKKV